MCLCTKLSSSQNNFQFKKFKFIIELALNSCFLTQLIYLIIVWVSLNIRKCSKHISFKKEHSDILKTNQNIFHVNNYSPKQNFNSAIIIYEIIQYNLKNTNLDNHNENQKYNTKHQ